MEIKKFESRKNEVFLNNDNTVTKRFKDPFSFLNEVKILEKLDGFHCPILLSSDYLEIKMNKIEGDLLLDVFLVQDMIGAAKTGQLLGETIIELYNKLDGLIPNDENFRNYIINKDKIYRIDFEETKQGSLEEWCGKVLAFAIFYDVKQEVKGAFMVGFLDAFEFGPHEVIEYYHQEIEELVNRRRIIYPSKNHLEIEDIVFGVWEEE
jgi:tRNA A-37 threonylcarbamoyl transferase component Bud32